MKSYSTAARAFICFVCALGLTALLSALLGPVVRGDKFLPLPTLLAMAASGIAGTRKIYLLRTREQGQSRYVTLGFLVTFATLLALGVRAGVLAGLTSAFCADLYTYSTDTYKRRLQRHQILFNAASIAITAWCAGHVFAVLNGTIGHVESRSLGAVVAAMLCYFLINTCSLALVLSLCSHRRFLFIWREDFLWAFPLHLMGAAYVAFAIMFIHDISMILFAASVVPFAYQYYKMYGDHVAQKQALIEELEAGREMLSGLYSSTVKSLATAIAAKDQYTHAHIHRVQHYAVAVAQKLGVTGDEMEAIRTGAVLHDIGKLGVPDYVLLKPGSLNEDEYAKMKLHPVVGADILEPVNFPWPVVDVVRHHHERWDGKGYPDGLKGEAIPLGARILTVADVYDALTTARPYRAAWSHEQTEAYLIAQAGIQFDAGVVAAFVSIVGDMTVPPCAENQAQNAQNEDGAQAGRASSQTSRQIGRTASELWVLYDVGSTLGSAAPMQERLRLLGGSLTSIMPGTTCAFMLYDSPEEVRCASPAPERCTLADAGHVPASEAREHRSGRYTAGVTDDAEDEDDRKSLPTNARGLHLIAAAGLNADLLYDYPFVHPNAPSARAAAEGKTYRGAYCADGLSRSLSHPPERPVESILIVPLKSGTKEDSEIMGVMTFYHHAPDAFTKDDENLLTMIADQVQAALCQNRVHDQTRSEANTDALTGLHNMRYLRHATDTLLHTSDASGATGFALLYLDLDNFKNVNTVYGHPVGSQVLSDVAGLLPRELRPSDVAVRYGGDEFVVILPHASLDVARDVAARIRAAIRSYRPASLADFDATCRLDVSIGIACCPHDGASMEELVAVADQRMYENKMAQKGLERHMDTRHASGHAPPLETLSLQSLSVESPASKTLPREAALWADAPAQSLSLDTAVAAAVFQRWMPSEEESAAAPAHA